MNKNNSEMYNRRKNDPVLKEIHDDIKILLEEIGEIKGQFNQFTKDCGPKHELLKAEIKLNGFEKKIIKQGKFTIFIQNLKMIVSTIGPATKAIFYIFMILIALGTIFNIQGLKTVNDKLIDIQARIYNHLQKP